jgi:hypothetical protein
MRPFEGYKKVVEVSKEHPDLIAEIDEFLEKGRNLRWITGRLNFDLEKLGRISRLELLEVAGFLRHRRALQEKQQRLRKAKGMSKREKNSTLSGEQASIANSAPAEGKPGPEESAKEPVNALSDEDRRKRAAEDRKRTHEEIVVWAGEVVKDVFLKAREDPESDAATVVKVLLINQVVANEEKLTEEVVTKLMEVNRKYEELQGQKTKQEGEMRDLEGRITVSRQKARALELANKEKEKKIKNIEKVLSKRRQFSPDQIYDKISAVIGMGDTVVERVERQPAPGI